MLTTLIPFLSLVLIEEDPLLSLLLPAANPEGLWLLATRPLPAPGAEPIKLLTLTTFTCEVEWFFSVKICSFLSKD